MEQLIQISLHKGAVFIPQKTANKNTYFELKETTYNLIKNCNQMGYTFSEELVHAVNTLSIPHKMAIYTTLSKVTGIRKNWTPLIKQWDVPIKETRADHVTTLLANIFPALAKSGTELRCGHFIPKGTFPLERYNGCPFCGTPFSFDALNIEPEKHKLTVLELWTEKELTNHLEGLLASAVPLDATQVDSLGILLEHYGLPKNSVIKMKENVVLVIDALVKQGKADNAGSLFKTPTDILRYLWFKHTGFLQLVEPSTILRRKVINGYHVSGGSLDKSQKTKALTKEKLKLKFSRETCRMYAGWINNLPLSTTQLCEDMHPKRNMWVRVIRALRLAEYGKRKGYENLAHLLDAFYNKNYEVWQSKVNRAQLSTTDDKVFELLKQRPGAFARSLFSCMLWQGPETTLHHFKQVIDQVPLRLVFSLAAYAETYFDRKALRTVKPLGGVQKKIQPNQFLELYTDLDLHNMKNMVLDLVDIAINKKFALQQNDNATIYIDEQLFTIPVAIGDRSQHVQDLPEVAMGTRMKVEGDKIRLFMQWGNGLPAQHLDMDLSCSVVGENFRDFCSYQNLSIEGCQHSGDIQHIPDKVGTAEYIELDLNVLSNRNAQYVCFTCNAYTHGSLTPNMVVGWMNSASPMKISKSGVAYHPAAVQQQVRITNSLTKGMVFGVLDVAAREIIWLEMAFHGQVVQNMNFNMVKGLIEKMDAKLKIGELLMYKADAQSLAQVDSPELADEVYDAEWLKNTKAVHALLFD
tara:strand:- start:3609 stop:5858 length:2250 start_codon:yes stop_codon:yes gene_type:complete